jgi:hypothetical protein
MIDFDSKDFQIEMNNDRLKEESERYNEIRSRIGYISIFYTAFSVYTIPLIEYLFSNKFPLLYTIIFGAFLILFLVSLVFGILLLLPQDVAFKELPKTFYDETRAQYKNKGIPDKDIKYYIRETYLNQIEKSVELNFKLNNKKSKYHHWAFRLAIYAIIPYFICVGYSVFNKKDDNPIKVEIVKSNINLNDSIMCKNEQDNQNQQGGNTQSQEPKIDTSQVIQRDPVLIKEGKEAPSNPNTGNSQTDKK